MAVEPYTAAAFIVSVSAMLTAAAATFAATYVRSAKTDAARARRLLEGEGKADGVIDRLDDVEQDVEEIEDGLVAVEYDVARVRQEAEA